MTKMLSGSVLLLPRVCPTQLNSAAMLLSQLTVSSVWCCTMDRISSYWSLDASSSWETSSSSKCSSRTLGHSGERKRRSQVTRCLVGGREGASPVSKAPWQTSHWLCSCQHSEDCLRRSWHNFLFCRKREIFSLATANSIWLGLQDPLHRIGAVK